MKAALDLDRAAALRSAPYDRQALLDFLTGAVAQLRFGADRKGRLAGPCEAAVDVLGACIGDTLQERWSCFERTVWPKWMAGEDRPLRTRWRWGARVFVITRLVLPSWEWMRNLRVQQLLQLSDRHAQYKD